MINSVVPEQQDGKPEFRFAVPCRKPLDSRARLAPVSPLCCSICPTRLSMSYETILVDILDGGVGLVTMNRPKELNSFNNTMCYELILAYDALEKHPDVKVIVVTGAGRAFCAGADLTGGGFTNVAGGLGSSKDFRDPGGQVAVRVGRLQKPVIAAINGPAIGLGITMTLPMDIRITHKDAKIGFVFARRGIVLESSSSFYLPRLIGTSRALALSLMARVHTAGDDLLSGLFAQIVAKQDQVLPAALAVAREIAEACSPVSIALTKSLIWRGTNSAEEQHLLDSELFYYTSKGADTREGVNSFMEKRPAVFPGRVHFRSDPSKNVYGLPLDTYPWWKATDISQDPDWPNTIDGLKRKLDAMKKRISKI
ncbi:ClpP/crotonase [Gonapodya prolifera JEL478]|uniref:ClpP/crotonase n=1 Tax=Gonapodya prolifera (strain JEL478) TaxID=1344416 RepID=A0A139AS77_GONPJ|nr:ClpP/crotonase [Gonapodya prolifera JEL478]|eukprot:KXS19600.1 ClpP/crotonase [Gonapodya prolifera JEL478]